jgi:hypothetical protein
MDSWQGSRGSRGPTGKRGMASEDRASRGGHHSLRTCARKVRLLCIADPPVTARRQEGASGLNQSERHASAAQATHPSAVRLSVDCQRVSSSASPASEVLIIHRARPARARGPSSSSSPSPEPFELKCGRPALHSVTAEARKGCTGRCVCSRVLVRCIVV